MRARPSETQYRRMNLPPHGLNRTSSLSGGTQPSIGVRVDDPKVPDATLPSHFLAMPAAVMPRLAFFRLLAGPGSDGVGGPVAKESPPRTNRSSSARFYLTSRPFRVYVSTVGS
jgi:hypothetical protein